MKRLLTILAALAVALPLALVATPAQAAFGTACTGGSYNPIINDAHTSIQGAGSMSCWSGQVSQYTVFSQMQWMSGGSWIYVTGSRGSTSRADGGFGIIYAYSTRQTCLNQQSNNYREKSYVTAVIGGILYEAWVYSPGGYVGCGIF
jgi:hypothetical protein